MIVVVSDTSPLNYLILLEIPDVLPQLFDRVYAPPQVLAELRASGSPGAVQAWASAPPSWLNLRQPATIVQGLALDAGETHAISLAEEMRADRILLDERRATRVARGRGLAVLGTLGILAAASDRGVIQLAPMLTRLMRQTNFRASQDLIDRLLQNDARRRTPPTP